MTRRPRYAIPADVEAVLRASRLMEAYRERPAYQQNDYVLWITRAKRDATRRKRLDQMLAELREGGVYMNMPHGPSRKR